ncbi:hypothetical protein [Achromobacter sp. UMC71]|uniref:hypothetical protein n=1 Tax=Achromobacter sp. UMC71 TaxID=1862320 RepID=UPI001601E480|nr:hypothetical protein [Achromobacter sp. UMC71]
MDFHSNKKKNIFIKNGNIRSSVQFLLIGIGGGISYLGSEISSYWVGVIGICVGAVGGYAGLAGSVGVKPFKDESDFNGDN